MRGPGNGAVERQQCPASVLGEVRSVDRFVVPRCRLPWRSESGSRPVSERGSVSA